MRPKGNALESCKYPDVLGKKVLESSEKYAIIKLDE